MLIQNCQCPTSQREVEASSASSSDFGNWDYLGGGHGTLEEPFDYLEAEKKGYINLLSQGEVPDCPFERVLYNPGQIDLLKWKIETSFAPVRVIYYAALTAVEDARYLEAVLKHTEVEQCPDYLELQNKKSKDLNNDIPMLIPVIVDSCPTTATTKKRLSSVPRGISDLIKIGLDLAITMYRDSLTDTDPIISLATVSRDHDKRLPTKMGSLCVQIHEPITLSELSRARRHITGFGSLGASEHVLIDLHLNYPILQSHLVAFLILSRDGEFGKYELIQDYQYLLSVKALKFHCAFEGEPKDVVETGLSVLDDYITYKGDDTYTVKYKRNRKALVIYMERLLPIFAPFTIVARGLLYTRLIHPSWFKSRTTVRVRQSKKNVMECMTDLFKDYKGKIYCRKPCMKISEFIESTLNCYPDFFRLNLPVKFECSTEHEEDSMVQCELCRNKWHSKCIAVEEFDVAKLRCYYCIWCREKHPNLREIMSENVDRGKRAKLAPQAFVTTCRFNSPESFTSQSDEVEPVKEKTTYKFQEYENPDDEAGTASSNEWVYLTRSIPELEFMARCVTALTNIPAEAWWLKDVL